MGSVKQVLWGDGGRAWHFFFRVILRYRGTASPRQSRHSGFCGHLDVTEHSLRLRDAGCIGGSREHQLAPAFTPRGKVTLCFMKVREHHLSAPCMTQPRTDALVGARLCPQGAHSLTGGERVVRGLGSRRELWVQNLETWLSVMAVASTSSLGFGLLIYPRG